MNKQDFQAALAACKVPKRHDPILEELWEIKAQINKDAGYNLQRLADNARRNTAHLIGPDGRVKAMHELG